ncbi:lymphocyte antigen 6D-like [Perognathus longimembris pacificus]|uniref:lymphocyte antigen 6D-like n=1 Tax=Perognathus longimembris pacificus TaxID=214514 RepID=UPI002018C6F9|nr:lymphocyte antigen 6D-like [Perognathus longimembris pacificus]
MRPLLVLLLLAAVCAALARALHCHVCCGHENCESLVECALTDKFCVITRATHPGGILVMKSCASVCPNGTVSADGRVLSVSCCQGGQCDRSAASGLAGSRAALWAGASASLLWALLRAACLRHPLVNPLAHGPVDPAAYPPRTRPPTTSPELGGASQTCLPGPPGHRRPAWQRQNPASRRLGERGPS